MNERKVSVLLSFCCIVCITSGSSSGDLIEYVNAFVPIFLTVTFKSPRPLKSNPVPTDPRNVCVSLTDNERNVGISFVLLDERVIVSFASTLEGVESSCVFCFVNKVIVQSDAMRINELEIMNCFFVRSITCSPFSCIIYEKYTITNNCYQLKNLSFHSSFYSFIGES